MSIIETLLDDAGVESNEVVDEETRNRGNQTVQRDHEIDEGAVRPPSPDVPEGFIPVEDWNDLDEMREDPGSDYALANDLDKNTDGYQEVGVDDGSFEPIGEFSGTLDGQNNTIAGAQIGFDELKTGQKAGLFEKIESDAVIENLVLEGFEVAAGGTVLADGGVAPLAAFSEGTVSNVHSQDATVVARFKGSGLVADTEGGIIENSSVRDTTVTGNDGLGGLVAAHQGTIERCSVTGSVVAQGETQAGVGGLVGEHAESEGDESIIVDSYALVDVDIDFGNEGGGLIGSYGRGEPEIKRSFAAGELKNDDIGGLTGFTTSEENVTNSFWDTDATRQDESGAGEGLSTEQMQGTDAADTLDSFDFEDIWRITDGYPELR